MGPVAASKPEQKPGRRDIRAGWALQEPNRKSPRRVSRLSRVAQRCVLWRCQGRAENRRLKRCPSGDAAVETIGRSIVCGVPQPA